MNHDCANFRLATSGEEQLPLVVLPYMAGVSENIRQVCGNYGMKVIFKAGQSVCAVLTKVKDPLPMEKAKVVY